MEVIPCEAIGRRAACTGGPNRGEQNATSDAREARPAACGRSQKEKPPVTLT